MIKHPDTDYIDPLDMELKNHPVQCSYVEAEPNNLPWYFDTEKYLEIRIYPENATSNQLKLIHRMTLNFFLTGEILCRMTPDLGLIRYIDVSKAVKLIEQIHAEICGMHMNGLTLVRKIL